MIYLKVRGGLCNRIRALDSLLILCEQQKKNLTVLWPNDVALNADFDLLFETPKVDGFEFEIISCPPGFPENSLPNLKNRFKNFLKGRKIPNHLKTIAKKIHEIKDEEKMSASFLDETYNKIISETQGKVEEMDNIFCARLQDKTQNFMEKGKDVYINSCYRLHEVMDNYSNFVPKDKLAYRIKQTSDKFGNTFGLHIRRSDHEASKKYSTLDKFTNVIENALATDPEVTFFLSTDDSITKDNLLKKYGDKIICNEISSYDRNSPEAVVDAVIDLYCLSRTKKLYGSHHSSFSQVAAKIGGIEEITVK